MSMEFLVRGALDYGEPGVFMSFEERAEDLAENVRSLGFDLDEMVAHRFVYRPHVRLLFVDAVERRSAHLHLERLIARRLVTPLAPQTYVAISPTR